MKSYQIDCRYTASTYVFVKAEDEAGAREQVQGVLEHMTYGLLDYYEVKDIQEKPETVANSPDIG